MQFLIMSETEQFFLCLRTISVFLSSPRLAWYCPATKLTAMINCPGVLFASVELGDATGKHIKLPAGALGQEHRRRRTGPGCQS